jgi:hypothetical protein
VQVFQRAFWQCRLEIMPFLRFILRGPLGNTFSFFLTQRHTGHIGKAKSCQLTAISFKKLCVLCDYVFPKISKTEITHVLDKNHFIMIAKIALLVLSILGFKQVAFAQEISPKILRKDTTYWTTTPTLVKASSLVTTQSIGFQASVEKYFIQKEINKIRKSGRIKTIRKDRFLSLDLGYYYQAGLHHNWFLTGTYNLRRTGKRGIYAEFSPFIGVSRTFISDETYKVNSNGGVELSNLAGDWFVTSGFSYGIGKTFNASKSFISVLSV